jgi:uncharacterized phage-associated protein
LASVPPPQKRFRRGTHLVASRTVALLPLYAHHGIYVGRGKVIHFEGFAEAFKKGPIRRTTLEDFIADGNLSIQEHPDARPSQKIVEAAQEALDNANNQKWEYHLILNNCEHFANWCVTGKMVSEQVDTGLLIFIGPVGRLIVNYFTHGDEE